MPDFDAMIAAAALARDMMLVTHNAVDFQPVTGLRFADWLDR